MSQPKHQHFIPKTYLRNFAIEKDGKFFVQAKHKDDEAPKERLFSIKDICVENNLYTIPLVEEQEKYAIEKYYAENIDGVYPEVYDLLTNDKVTQISKNQKQKVISTTLSLFFRTPKFLNEGKRRLNKILDYASSNFADGEGNIKFRFMDYNLDFNIKNIDLLKQDLQLKNKTLFLQNHLKDWHDFIEFKQKSPISVSHINENNNLITSDNPLIMRNPTGYFHSPFDPENIIYLPLDSKHFLTIYPNTIDIDSSNTIFRGSRDKWFALTTNLSVEQNAENWIIGEPGTLELHLNEQKIYGAYTEENLQSVAEMKEKGTDLQKLNDVITEAGTMVHQKVADFVNELLQKPIHKNDPEMQKIVHILVLSGFQIKPIIL